MGKLTADGQELANIAQTTVLANANDVTPWIALEGTFNFAIWGAGTGTVVLERSFDGGTTAIPVTNLGQAVSFTGPASENMFSREAGVLWRARRSVDTAGDFTVRFSQ